MLLNLGDKYRILQSDKWNLSLEKYDDIKDKKTKEVVRQDWVHMGYFGTSLVAALKKYKNETMMDLDQVNVDELINHLKRSDKHIETVVKNIDWNYTYKKDSKEDE